MKIQTINIKTIRIDGGTQARAQIDLTVVEDYAGVLADGDELPPVSVMHDGSDYWLVDGFHRLRAHLKDGRAFIPAIVQAGTSRDAILRSLSTNLTHGLRLSNIDKRKAVQTMLDDAEWGAWSNRQIAKMCGVSHFLVNEMRTKVEDLPPEEPVAASQVTPQEFTGVETLPPLEPIAEPMPALKVGKGTTADPPSPKLLTAAEQAASEQDEAAFGGVTVAQLLDETEAECIKLHALVAAAEEDDQKAATIKWRRIADIAQRRQNELMDAVNQRERELKRVMNIVRGVCEAMGTEDQTKAVSMVKAMVYANSAAAA